MMPGVGVVVLMVNVEEFMLLNAEAIPIKAIDGMGPGMVD